jgi:hypothetical protein
MTLFYKISVVISAYFLEDVSRFSTTIASIMKMTGQINLWKHNDCVQFASHKVVFFNAKEDLPLFASS